MSKSAEITFADVLQLFRFNDEFRWMWLRSWVWNCLLKPMLLGAGIVTLVFSVGFAFGKGISMGWNLQPPTLNLRLEGAE